MAVLAAGPIRLSADMNRISARWQGCQWRRQPDQSGCRVAGRPLRSGADDEIKRAVEGLAARYDQAHYALMQGLFKGEVYRWGERQAQHGLVIVGDEVKFISDGAGDPTQFALESLITF